MRKFQTGDLVRMRGNINNPTMIVTTHTGSTLKEGYYDCSWWDNGYRHQVFAEHELEDAVVVHPPQTTEPNQPVTPKERKYVHLLTGEVCERQKARVLVTNHGWVYVDDIERVAPIL